MSDEVMKQEEANVGACMGHRAKKGLEVPEDPLNIECDKEVCRFDCPLAPHNSLWYHVEAAVEMVEWLEKMPQVLYGTHISERVWDYLGEKVDEVLGAIGAPKDEEGVFDCYDEDGGPQAVLEAWLESRKEDG